MHATFGNLQSAGAKTPKQRKAAKNIPSSNHIRVVARDTRVAHQRNSRCSRSCPSSSRTNAAKSINQPRMVNASAKRDASAAMISADPSTTRTITATYKPERRSMKARTQAVSLFGKISPQAASRIIVRLSEIMMICEISEAIARTFSYAA